MILYKLTDRKDQTYGGCQWGRGITHKTSGIGELCNPGWLHFTTSPLLAVLLDPCQGTYTIGKKHAPHLWECRGVVGRNDHGLKIGCMKGTTIKRVRLPKITQRQRIAFAILCARKVCKAKRWRMWAKNWLSGKDRSKAAARRAKNASGSTPAYHAACAVAYSFGQGDLRYPTALAAHYAVRRAAFRWKSFDLARLARQAMKY